jgi:hypothetical protein
LLSKILRFLFKLVFAVFALVLGLSVLAAALIMVVLSVLRALLTGKKPAPAVVFRRFQDFQTPGVWPGASSGAKGSHPASTSEVVDVEVREVRDDKRLH